MSVSLKQSTRQIHHTSPTPREPDCLHCRDFVSQSTHSVVTASESKGTPSAPPLQTDRDCRRAKSMEATAVGRGGPPPGRARRGPSKSRGRGQAETNTKASMNPGAQNSTLCVFTDLFNRHLALHRLCRPKHFIEHSVVTEPDCLRCRNFVGQSTSHPSTEPDCLHCRNFVSQSTSPSTALSLSPTVCVAGTL